MARFQHLNEPRHSESSRHSPLGKCNREIKPNHLHRCRHDGDEVSQEMQKDGKVSTLHTMEQKKRNQKRRATTAVHLLVEAAREHCRGRPLQMMDNAYLGIQYTVLCGYRWNTPEKGLSFFLLFQHPPTAAQSASDGHCAAVGHRSTDRKRSQRLQPRSRAHLPTCGCAG